MSLSKSDIGIWAGIDMDELERSRFLFEFVSKTFWCRKRSSTKINIYLVCMPGWMCPGGGLIFKLCARLA